MKNNKKSFKLPLGCLVVLSIVVMLCMGCFGISMLQGIFVPTSPPMLITEIILTATLEALAVPSLTVTVIPTFTFTESTPTFLPMATDTPVPLVIPVTGASCIPNNPPQTGKVVQVIDGDTIKVLLDQDGLTYSVRYIGMDTPENTSQIEYFGPEATSKNKELVEGKAVTLIKDVSETDRYGRLLRYVLVENTFINYELVAQGYANTASFPPDISCISTFQTIEKQASSSKLGLWSAPPTLVVIPVMPSTASSGGNNSGNGPCSCGGSDLDCKDFKLHSSAQACFEYCRAAGYGDVFRLDGSDNDGLACESLP